MHSARTLAGGTSHCRTSDGGTQSFLSILGEQQVDQQQPRTGGENPRTRDAAKREPQKLPSSDAEIKMVYDACQRYGGTYRHK
jgi:hypothetical protein